MLLDYVPRRPRRKRILVAAQERRRARPRDRRSGKAVDLKHAVRECERRKLPRQPEIRVPQPEDKPFAISDRDDRLLPKLRSSRGRLREDQLHLAFRKL